MNELFWVAIVVVFVVSIPLILLGMFFRTEKSHQFINGRDRITNIYQYATNTGNSLIAAGLVIILITLLFSMQFMGAVVFGILVSVASLLPLPCVIYTHMKYT
jgi:hypothetical protein